MAALILGLPISVGMATFLFGKPSPVYASDDKFAGCYRALHMIFMLQKDGSIAFNGKSVGHYRILDPVGGKHGYLLETQNFSMTLDRGRLVAQPIGGGTTWNINDRSLDVVVSTGMQMPFVREPCSGPARS